MTTFEFWLNENKDKFSTYSTDEIKDLALSCGFSLIEVSQWATKERFRKAA